MSNASKKHSLIIHGPIFELSKFQFVKSTDNPSTHNGPDVHAHEVLQGLDGDGSCRDEEPEALLEAQGRLDLLEHDLVGDHVAPVGRGGVAVD